MSAIDKIYRKAQREFSWLGRIYDFKSKWATWFMKSGGDVFKLMLQCGWKDLSTAMVYVQFSPDASNQIRGRVKF